MLDQSPHQLARARAQAGARARARSCSATRRSCRSATDRFDRYVSAGSIEYWPDPQRAIAEAYRVLRAGGARDGDRPGAARPTRLLRAAGGHVDAVPDRGASTAAGWSARGSPTSSSCRSRPRWYRSRAAPYAVAASGRKPAPGAVAAAAAAAGRERVRRADDAAARRAFALRFAAGSLAGALFVPLAAALALRQRAAGAARR